MKRLTHGVLITGDDTDVFGGTIIEEVPPWAKHLLVITGFSDYDSLIDLVVQKEEYMRQSSPHVFAADNVLNMELDQPHVVVPVDRVSDYDVNMNWNVVTSGTGIALAMYTSN